MKAQQFYTKTFSNKKTVLPFFITIVVLQIIMAVLSMLGEQHWIIFADAISALGLIIAIFLCNHYNKIKAARVLTTLVFFTQAIFLLAYSFQPFPKAPDALSGMIAFIIYVFYAATFFCLTISATVLHADLNKVRNDQSMHAMYILYIIQIIFSLVLIGGAITNFSMAGYTHMQMVDLINYIAYGIINFFLLTLDTLTVNNKQNKK